MVTKVLRTGLWIILPVLIVVGLIIQTVGADVWASDEDKKALPIDLLISQNLYGPLRPVDPHELEADKNLTFYEDAKYRYSVHEDGRILSMIRLATVSSSPDKDLTSNQAISLSEDVIKNVFPGFDNYSFDIVVEQFENNDTPWRVFHRLIDEDGILYGAICTFIDRDGEVRMLSSDISPQKPPDNDLPIDTLIEEALVIDRAYQALAEWDKNHNTTKLNIEDRDSHTVEINRHYDTDHASICWVVRIKNVKKITNTEKAYYQSFLITINAQTGEIIAFYSSR